jgi:site-specific DNA-methyltransferase (adenine-specific)
MTVELYQGDCLRVMDGIESGSIDLVLADPPYGTTACKWDSVIDLELMWLQLKRIIKQNGAIVLFCGQPFTSVLINSNLKMFKYCWEWEKSRPAGHLNAKKMPLKNVEDIAVFYQKQCTYNPIFTTGKPNNLKDGSFRKSAAKNNCYGETKNYIQTKTDLKYPRQTLKFNSLDPRKMIHPTEKPVPMAEYLIKTYTNKNQTVLDFCIGSGAFGEGCINLTRNFIGIEKDPIYFKIAQRRIKSAEHQMSF